MNSSKISLKAFIGLVLISLIAVGCNATTPSTVSPSGFRDGTYAIDTTKLKFEKGHFTQLTQFDQEIAQGSFVVSGNRITFTEQDFAPECGPEDSPYTYQWSFDGKALTFSNPDDQCLSRSMFFTEQSWAFVTQK